RADSNRHSAIHGRARLPKTYLFREIRQLIFLDYFWRWPPPVHFLRPCELSAYQTRNREDFHGRADFCLEPEYAAGGLRHLVQPHPHNYPHGGDCRSLLGGFPLSRAAEAISRWGPSESCRGAHLWRGIPG